MGLEKGGEMEPGRSCCIGLVQGSVFGLGGTWLRVRFRRSLRTEMESWAKEWPADTVQKQVKENTEPGHSTLTEKLRQRAGEHLLCTRSCGTSGSLEWQCKRCTKAQ